MAKIENDFLGLCDVHGDCVVTADIWSRSDKRDTVVINTNSNKVKRAFSYGKRYGLDKTLELSKNGKNQTELLRAIMYRAKVTEDKSLCIGQRGCVAVGVLNKK